MRIFSLRLFLPSATYLKLVNAEFLCAGFLLSYCQGGGCPLSCCCPNINTADNMGTEAMTLPAALRMLGTLVSFHSAIGVRVMLPILLLLVPPLTQQLG